jgi:hypothetical protein
MIKLYDIKRESKIKLPISNAAGHTTIEMCTFKHLDGMYSLIETPAGDPVHLAAWTPLKLVDDHYEIDEEEQP